MNKVEVKIPDIGEIDNVEIIEVCVAAGDQVEESDVLVVLESDKASMEVPAPCQGRIADVAVALGDQVSEGVLIVVIEGDDASAPEAASVTSGGSEAKTAPVPEKAPPEKAPPEKAPPAKAAPAPAVAPATTTSQDIYAGPGVRRFARELGVDLAQVKATGNHNRILKEDVQQFVRRLASGQALAATDGTGIPAIPDQDYSKFGPIEIKPVGRIARRGAEQLRASWLNLPQVTNHDEADITRLDAFRREQAQAASDDEPKLTLLPFILKACAVTLTRHPQLNGSLIEAGNQFVYKRYVHIGIAVDTPDGLIVPVIRDVDQKSVRTLTKEVSTLAEKSRHRQLLPGDMQGASFTVSSLGALGGTGFTPIVNAPQVAILGVAKTSARPTYLDSGELEKRLIMPLSLSYDHRAVNGADAGRFMVMLKAYLEDIRRLLL